MLSPPDMNRNRFKLQVNPNVNARKNRTALLSFGAMSYTICLEG